eukprot:COSAG01_NODE_746_length_13865_cov_11.259625_10_plen_84_part_00
MQHGTELSHVWGRGPPRAVVCCPYAKKPSPRPDSAAAPGAAPGAAASAAHHVTRAHIELGRCAIFRRMHYAGVAFITFFGGLM